MKNIYRLILVLLCFVCTTQVLWAQVIVDDTFTPEELVQNVLLGNGVSVSNITFNGQPGNVNNCQIAYFNSENSNIGLDEGVVLASGIVSELIVGPNNNTGFTSFDTQACSDLVINDPDLMQASGFNMNDCAILEFDFVPNGDSLVFKYVFSSEEYSNFSCSNFNDVFGFFVSGPGISGPFSNDAINIALIPGTNTPVGINTVGPITDGIWGGEIFLDNCLSQNPNYIEDTIYYFNNEVNYWDTWAFPTDPPEGIDTNATQMDGLTVGLVAIANVQCGETYHIKMAIGDASDASLDSAVFLEAESFTSNSTVVVEFDSPIGGNTDSTLFEGCGYANLIFSRPGDTTIAEVAYLEYSGTAQMGIDYTELPDSIYFAPGQSTVIFQVTAPNDGTEEGPESVVVSIENISTNCLGENVTIVSEFTFYIDEAGPLEVSLNDGEIEACGDSVLLDLVVSGGYGEYGYNWNDGFDGTTRWVSPGTTTNYIVTVTDTCGAQPVTVDATVTVPVYPPLSAYAGEDQVLETCNSTVNLQGQGSGGNGEFTYQWLVNNQVVGNSNVLVYTAEQLETTLTLLVFDGCGLSASDQIVLTVPPVDMTAIAGPEREVTDCREPEVFNAFAYGGIGSYSYKWFVGEDTLYEESISVTPVDGQILTLVAEDECGNRDTSTTAMVFNLPEMELEVTPDQVICEGDEVIVQAIVSGGVGDIDYTWLHDAEAGPSFAAVPETNQLYRLTVQDECLQVLQGASEVVISRPRAAFDVSYVPYYAVQTINRSTPADYLWDFGDGYTSGEKSPYHEYRDNARYTVQLTVTDSVGCRDEQRVELIPPMQVFVPNSFTPNADDKNDLFSVSGVEVLEFEMVIYDRWGAEVWRTNNIDDKWNGTGPGGTHLLPAGLYPYVLKAKGPKEEDTYEDRGVITLIR